MKKIIICIIVSFLFLINLKAEHYDIYNINDYSIYENPNYTFKYLFDDSHNLSVTVDNINKDLTCEFQVEFFDDNNKLIYFNYYNSNIYKNEKEYIIDGVDYPRKNLVTKYRITTICNDYIEESYQVETNTLNENDIFSISEQKAIIFGISIFVFNIIFTILITIVFIKIFKRNRL